MRTATLEQSFGRVIKQIRVGANLTQEQVAHASGLALNYVSDLERGKRNPSLGTVLAIADALGVAPHIVVRRTVASLKGK